MLERTREPGVHARVQPRRGAHGAATIAGSDARVTNGRYAVPFTSSGTVAHEYVLIPRSNRHTHTSTETYAQRA
jgi:hypothetical protein